MRRPLTAVIFVFDWLARAEGRLKEVSGINEHELHALGVGGMTADGLSAGMSAPRVVPVEEEEEEVRSRGGVRGERS